MKVSFHQDMSGFLMYSESPEELDLLYDFAKKHRLEISRTGDGKIFLVVKPRNFPGV